MIEGLRIAADIVVIITGLFIVGLVVFSRVVNAVDRTMPDKEE